jgi:type IV pilus assembly protein PilX
VSRIVLITRRTQRGAVLFIALIVLVAMSLAGLALMRGVDRSTAASAGTDAAGNQVSYVIQRLCELPGDPASVNCIRAAGASSTSSGTKGAASYGGYAISAPTGAFYRITVRVTGPRNTVSFVQATVY